MKKLALIAAACMVTFGAAAQHADIGIHGGFGTSWMINNNISDQGGNLDPELTMVPVFGIHMGYSINKTLGIRTEINYALISQKYKGEEAPNYKFTGKDHNTYLELPVLLMLQSGAFYCEVGPKFSFITGARSDYKDEQGSSSLEEKNVNVLTSYKNAFVSAVLGVGGNFKLSKGWYLNAGLRFSWGLGDATREFKETDILSGNVPDYVSTTTTYAHQDQKGLYSYEKTHVATGHIIIGLSRRFPY